MRTLIYWPPLKKTSGGMMVLAQVASQLGSLGHDISLAMSAPMPTGIALHENVKLVPFKELDLAPQDRWVVPEGWPNALSPGFKAGCSCSVFVQNWMPFLGLLPDGVRWNRLPVSMLAISHPVKNFIRETTGLSARIIPPALASKFFYCDGPNAPDLSRRPLRIAHMPRKNRGIVTQIADIIASRSALPQSDWYPRLEWLEIHGQTQENVGRMLRDAHIFLAVGFPEGFGLPPLEAMACGCLVAGFTGLGGWDYMRPGESSTCVPPFPLQQVSWGANGFYAADGDIWGGAMAQESAIRTFVTKGGELENMLDNCLTAAQWYSEKRQREAIEDVWADDRFWDNAGKD